MNLLLTRRAFLGRGLAFAAGAPLALESTLRGADPAANSAAGHRSDAKVAIVPCRSYGPEVGEALEKSFDLLGGIGPLVRNKTATIKINLTGTNFASYLGRPVGETYMTHWATAMALGTLLFRAGARRVRFVESTTS